MPLQKHYDTTGDSRMYAPCIYGGEFDGDENSKQKKEVFLSQVTVVGFSV